MSDDKVACVPGRFNVGIAAINNKKMIFPKKSEQSK
jgi:hypothetical protein